jgi:TRAP-type mannitol/chloroaromatic compound transport system permease small subunit
LFVRIVDRIVGFSGIIAAWLIAPLVIATCYEVASRYLFNAPTIWAYEVGFMATGAQFLLGMAYTLNRGAHIRIDVLSTMMSEKTKAIIDLVCYVFLLLPFVSWVSWNLFFRATTAMRTNEHSGQSAWNPPLWPFRTIFFIAFFLLLLQVLAEIVKSVRVLTPDGEARS